MVASLTRHSEVNQLAQFDTKHLADWMNESGVSEEITKLNIESLTSKEVNERVRPKHPIKTGGWWCRGVNWRNGQPMGNRYGQVKPDKRHFNPDRPNDEGAKYLTASGMEPDAIFLRMPDPDYWRKVYEDKSIPIVWTEGSKKAGAGLTHGFATICVTGVYNWGKDFKFAPFVKLFIERGGDQYLAFDSDYREKPQCREAIRRFCNLAKMLGITIKIITWDSHYKGMDDFIKEKGKGAFEYQMFLAKNLENWEKQVNQDSKTKPPTPRKTAQEITEDYRPEWRYHNQQKTWRKWNGKCWESVDDGVFRSTIKAEIDGRGVDYSKADYITNVVSLTTDDLRIAKWETLEPYKYIPFDNGVLEIATSKLRKHNPNDGFTYALPHAYKTIEINDLLEALKSSCPDTYRYMMTAQQDNKLMVRKLLAAINGVITGKFSEHQIFLQLIGETRSGKGTFTRLLKECIGANNHASASLKDLAKPEIRASIIDKRLVECPEQRSTNDEAIGWLLALTGGDAISCKRLYKDPTSEKFNGCLVITSNRQIGTARFPELDERLCLITFNHTVPKDKRIHNLDGLIKKEIPQLIAIALSMTDVEVVHLLKGIGEGDNPAIKLYQWELKTEDAVVAAFFNDELIVEPGKSVTTSKLYENFKSYCSEQGKQALNLKKFSNELIGLCKRLDSEVIRDQDGRHTSWKGLRLREDWDTLPTYEQTLRQSLASIERVQSPIDTLINAPIETQTQKDFAPIAPIESNLSSTNVQQISENSPELPRQLEKEIIPKPQPAIAKPKPAIAKYTPDQKKKWLRKNQNIKATVWVNHPSYTGEATYERFHFNEPCWKVKHPNGELNVNTECIEVLKGLCGDIQPIPDKPEYTQPELLLEPQTETPVQRVKRLAKQQKIKLTPDDFNFSHVLKNYQKSEFQELTDEELAEIADRWEKQIDNAQREINKNYFTKNLEE